MFLTKSPSLPKIVNKDDEIEFKSIENQDELDEIIKLYEEMREESNGN